jgi:hypothetical protein
MFVLDKIWKMENKFGGLIADNIRIEVLTTSFIFN